MRKLVDVRIVVTDPVEVEACKEAILSGTPFTFQGHHGFVVELRPRNISARVEVKDDAVVVTITHTGIPQCDCKEEPLLGFR